MFDAIQLHSHVGADGSLDLHVDLGRGEEREVIVTIEPMASSDDRDAAEATWQEIVKRTYGSCAGLGLERPEQLPLEERDPID